MALNGAELASVLEGVGGNPVHSMIAHNFNGDGPVSGGTQVASVLAVNSGAQCDMQGSTPIAQSNNNFGMKLG